MIKVFTAFSGYDSQCLALKYLNLPFELIGWSEIDTNAIKAHNLLFPQCKDRNFGDISKIDWNKTPNFDLFTYSFPCTDISISGKRLGLSEGSNTRSSLLWECRKAIQIKRPKYLLLENVKNLTSNKFKPLLKLWLNELSSLGYSNNVKVLNSKDYGVPQSRERVFVVSILGDKPFYFPKKQRLTQRLKDVLLENVNNKYLIPKEKYLHIKNLENKPLKIIRLQQLANYTDDTNRNFKNPQHSRIYNINGLSTTITTRDSFNSKYLTPQGVRKLTPFEYLRLMGLKDVDIQILMGGGISETGLYKLAGNSIVVNVLMAIFDSLFINKTPKKNFQLKLF